MATQAARPSDVAEYRVVENTRAKHVRLRMTVEEGLLVVIPRGFDRDRIPDLLRDKAAWIERASARVDAHRRAIACTSGRPKHIDLRAIDRSWDVEWRATASERITLRDDGVRLVLSGAVDKSDNWRPALRRWLLDRGRTHLVPWLLELAGQASVEILGTSVRCQRTRWGSYSNRGTVSLNAQLLFLPPTLVRYVLHHELCHASHGNHSPAFWAHLAELEPEVDCLRTELREAWRFVPGWVVRMHGKTSD